MIPKIIHYCWFGKNDIPKQDRECIGTWKKFCPDYEIVEWNEDNYDVLKVPYMKEAYEAQRWGFVSDYARIDIIYHYGGIYLDTDVELLRSLDELLKYSGFAGIEKVTGQVAFGLGFGAEKGMPLLKELCNLYQKMHFRDERGNLDLTPNPKIITDFLISQKNYLPNLNGVHEFRGVTFLPPDYLCPMNFETGKTIITPNTYSIHHYHASWKTEEEKRAALEYRRYIDIFGEKIGDLLYQTNAAVRKGGVKYAASKIKGHIAKRK